MGLKSFIKDVIEEEKNKTPEQRQEEKDAKEKKKLDKVYEQHKDYLLDDEIISFYTFNAKGTCLFLDKRILYHDNTITGTKLEYHTIPYKNIKRFMIETAGLADIDTDIKLYLGGGKEESVTLKVHKDYTKTINKIILEKIL